MSIFPNLESICAPFKGILLDAAGVFWGGSEIGVLPGCKDTMERLVSLGKIIGILSNSTQLSEKEIEKLKRHGLIQGTHFHFYMTSGSFARQLFLDTTLPFPTPRKRFSLFGPPHPRFFSHQPLFQGTSFQETEDLEEADFLYISIPHIDGEDQTDPHVFIKSVEAYQKNTLPVLCVNPDLFAHEGKPPRAVVRQGSIAAMHAKQGGKIFYIGKPSNIMYRAAMESFLEFGVPNPQNVVMVGDTPETDIRGAKNFGMPSALVIKTGIMGDRISHQGIERAFQALPEMDLPDFILEKI